VPSEKVLAGFVQLESQPALGAFAVGLSPLDPAPQGADLTAEVPAPLASTVTAEGQTAEINAPAPTRDELVEAWGDFILNQLRPRVRAVFAVGRFLASDDTAAVLALPNAAHVERAKSDATEVAEAIGRNFGRRV
jgi:hypothetical protein